MGDTMLSSTLGEFTSEREVGENLRAFLAFQRVGEFTSEREVGENIVI